MAIRFPAPPLDSAEVVVFQAAANLLRGRRSIRSPSPTSVFISCPTGSMGSSAPGPWLSPSRTSPEWRSNPRRRRGEEVRAGSDYRTQLNIEHSGQPLVVIVRDRARSRRSDRFTLSVGIKAAIFGFSQLVRRPDA